MIMDNASSLKLTVNHIAILIIAIFTAFWLSACSVSSSSTVQAQTSVTTGDVAKNNPKSSTTIDPLAYQGCVYPPSKMVQACTAQSGVFSQQGRRGCYQCVLSYADAGKVCQDSADCQGKCKKTGEFTDASVKNQSGQCASDSSPFGCYQTIEKGVAQPAFCVD